MGHFMSGSEDMGTNREHERQWLEQGQGQVGQAEVRKETGGASGWVKGRGK